MTDITNNTSVEPLTTRVRELERLLEVSRNLSALLEPDVLLQSIIEIAAELTHSEEASILLYEEEANQLSFIATPWFKRDKMQEITVPLDNSIAGKVFKTSKPIIVQDAQSDPKFFKTVDVRTEFVTHTLLAVPLIFQGNTIGVINAVNKLGGQQFRQEDVSVLETLASQAAIAINNARLLKESQDAYEELAEADRMKSDFVAITSHELRTPLGLILGHSTYLSELVPDDIKPQLNVIVRSAMRLKDIVDDLAKVNNFQTGLSRMRARKINMNLLLKEVVAACNKMADEKNVTLRKSLPKDVLEFEGDGEKIGIALSHLLKNAIAFTGEGGNVSVAMEVIPGYLKISVIDDGVGIAAKDMERIFERFFQAEGHMTRKHGGMGLGLSVAQMMVEMHGGRIGVESSEGGGSTFSILLPNSTAQLGSAKKAFEAA
ncbi:MAG: ATP-binding protein [Chloroflexota bacterium]